MNTKQVKWLVKALKNKNILLGEGLSNEEIDEIKNIFQIEFPEDLELLLKHALPVEDSFVHWRYGLNSDKGRKEILQRINAPFISVLDDIKFANFWFRGWGRKPEKYPDQEEIARKYLLTYSKLVPIHGYKYIPARPRIAGNPVFSIHQTDIIYYANDLMDYLSRCFGVRLPESFGQVDEPAYIEFWSDLAI